MILQSDISPLSRWERCVLWDNLFTATKITPSGELEGRGKKASSLAVHTNVLRSNLSGVLFASFFDKGAQWVNQTALMKGLLEWLPAADPREQECVFTINPPLCLQPTTSSPPPSPSLTNGHIYTGEPPRKTSVHNGRTQTEQGTGTLLHTTHVLSSGEHTNTIKGVGPMT